jgi:hypothetical protein
MCKYVGGSVQGCIRGQRAVVEFTFDVSAIKGIRASIHYAQSMSRRPSDWIENPSTWQDQLFNLFLVESPVLSSERLPLLEVAVSTRLKRAGMSDKQLQAFVLEAASKLPAQEVDLDNARRLKGDQLGACAWLFIPPPTSDQYSAFALSNTPKSKPSAIAGGRPTPGRVPQLNSMPIRQSWAWFVYEREVSQIEEPAPRTRRPGYEHRKQFVSALTSAIERALGVSAELVLFAKSERPLSIIQVDDATNSDRAKKDKNLAVDTAAEKKKRDDRESKYAAEKSLKGLMSQLSAHLEKTPKFYEANGFSASELAKNLTIVESKQYKYSGDSPEGRRDSSGDTDDWAVPIYLRSARRGVVLGDPGAGKSTLLAAYLISQLAKGSYGVGLFVPFTFVAARALSERPKSTRDAVRTLIGAFTDWFPQKVSRPLFAAYCISLPEHWATICIDGLDEVDDVDAYDAGINLIQQLQEIRAQILFTSRVAGYVEPVSELKTYVVEELSQKKVLQFFRRWFGPDRVENLDRVIAVVTRQPQIGRLARNPMMAGMIAYVAEDDDFPTEIGALYDRYISNYLRRIWKPGAAARGDDFELEPLISTAQQIAWAMATRPSGSDWLRDRWAGTITAGEVRQAATDKSAARALLRTDGLILLRGAPEPRSAESERQYGWIHKTIQEHFVGRELATQYLERVEGILDTITAAVLRPRTWREAVVHMISLLPSDEQDAIVGQLRGVIEGSTLYAEAAKQIGEIALQLRPESPQRAQIVDALLDGHVWTRAFLLDPQATLEAARTRWFPLGSNSGWNSDAVPWEQIHLVKSGSMPTVDELDRVVRDDRYEGAFAVQLLAHLSPDRAVDALIARSSGTKLYVNNQVFESLEVSRDALDRVYLAASSGSMRSFWAITDLIPLLRGGKSVLDRIKLDDHAFQLRESVRLLWGGYDPRLKVEKGLRTSAIRGKEGHPVAVVVGDAYPEQALNDPAADWYARLGALFGVLSRWNLSRIADLDVSALHQAFGSPQPRIPLEESLVNLDGLFVSLLWLHSKAASRTAADLRELCAYHRNIHHWYPDERHEGAVTSYDVQGLVRTLIAKLAAHLAWSDAWPVLKLEVLDERRSAPRWRKHDAPASWFDSALTGLLKPSKIKDGERERAAQIEDHFIEAVTWGIKKRIPILGALPIPDRNLGLLVQVIKMAPPNWLFLDGNARALGQWLTDTGLLPTLRPRIDKAERQRLWRAKVWDFLENL